MRALVFDYDGLIVDSETPEYFCWKKVYADHGQSLPVQDWVHVVGGPNHFDMRAELERRLGRSIDAWEKVDAARVAHYRSIFEQKALLPGVQSLFDEGRRLGWKIGVASNATSGWVSSGLKRFGLDGHVGALRARDTAKAPKPDPAPYLEVLAELDAHAQLSFGFEDSAPGVAAARAAGLTVVAVPNELTKHHDLRAAHHLLESLEHFRLPE